MHFGRRRARSSTTHMVVSMANTYAIIEGGIVANLALSEDALEANWVLAEDGVSIGWLYADEAFSAPTVSDPGASPVPPSCTRRQGLLALLAHDHRRSEIEALIAAIPDDMEREAALIEYEAATWERSNPFLQQMWAALGGEPQQLDEVFRMAVTL